MSANLMTKDQVIELAKSVSGRGKSLNRDIQKLAASAIGYANVHGDVTIAQGIYETLSANKGLRLNSFVAYLEKFGKLEYDKTVKNFIYRKRDDVETDPMELFVSLAELPWYEAIKAKEPVSTYDVAAGIKAIIARCDRLAQQESVAIAHLELLEPLRSLIPAKAE